MIKIRAPIGNLNENCENQMEILELRTIMTEIKKFTGWTKKTYLKYRRKKSMNLKML